MKYLAKRMMAWMMLLAVLGVTMLPVCAAEGNVTYSGDAGQFIFAPGSDHSPTDLFPNFKDVMPGDTLTQTIVVGSRGSDRVEVKLFLRALGAQESSRDFLSRLSLTVRAKDSELFHAAADQQAQLVDWVELGTFSGSGQVELDVTLHVPVALGNEYMEQVGLLDWQFMVEEYARTPDDPDTPVGPSDPEQPDTPEDPEQPDKPDVPKTGDDVNVGLMAGMFVGSGVLLLLLVLLLAKQKKKDQD